MRQHLGLLLLPLLAPAVLAACQCRSKAVCIGHFASLAEAAKTACDLPGGAAGFCCDDIMAGRVGIALRDAEPMGRRLNRPEQGAEQDISNSLDTLREKKKRTTNLDKETAGHNLFAKPRKADKDIEKAALSLFHVMDDLGIGLRQADEGFDADNSDEVNNVCPWTTNKRPQCDSSPRKYRREDGSCNNEENPLFGMAATPFSRILPATYGIGDSTPRMAKDGSELPSARFVSQTIFKAGDRSDPEVSALFMQVGQFIDHDITLTPNAGIGPIDTPECCLKDNRDRDWVYPRDKFNGKPQVCYPIEVLSSDTFWRARGRRCMHLSRSGTSPTIFPNICEAGRYEQRNANTHWLDSSNVYGSVEKELEDVRDKRDPAFLATTENALLPTADRSRALLPTCTLLLLKDREPESCDIMNCGEGCAFVGGDVRVNEMPALTVQHTVWAREHNRVAGELQQINTRWDDERVFQETRRIVNAQWQNVIFTEWLPILLGPSYMRAFNLQPLTSGYSNDYDTNFSPMINNEFATAAFRFAHSLLNTNVPGMDARGRNVTKVDLKDALNRGSFVQERGFLENTLRGQSREPIAAFDSSFVDDVLDHLFEGEEKDNGGLDLTALNMQRGREHGVPGYNQYRERCASRSSNFGKMRNFDELTTGGFLTRSQVSDLKAAYNDVDDIDLFAGGILEKAHRDGLVGPTFKCIIGDQFVRLRRGDRFYYEHGHDPETRFTLAQLEQLRQSSMARVMCDNSDIDQAQPLMFRMPQPGNELVGCRDGSIPRLNLDAWRDT